MDLANNNIALFIDFENFPDVKSFDAFKLISKLKERGRIILKKAYADWGRYAGSKMQKSVKLTTPRRFKLTT